MNNINVQNILNASDLEILPVPASFNLLTAAQVCRRLAYSPAQLYFLAQRYGLATPIDCAARVPLWNADEIDDWRRWRDLELDLQLV